MQPLETAPYESTYGEWGARWWQWALEAPVGQNPGLDPTGEHCAYDQSGPVCIAGTFGGTASRECAVPAGRALFLPVINAAFIATEPDETEEHAHPRVTARIDDAQCDRTVIRVPGR